MSMTRVTEEALKHIRKAEDDPSLSTANAIIRAAATIERRVYGCKIAGIASGLLKGGRREMSGDEVAEILDKFSPGLILHMAYTEVPEEVTALAERTVRKDVGMVLERKDAK